MSSTLPNVPYSSAIADPSGRLSPPWLNFFKMLYERVGNQKALTNTELAVVQTEAVAAVTAQVATLTLQITALQTQVNQGFNDLGQGPVL